VTALSILAQATAAGLTLRPAGDKIRFKPVGNMTAELQAALVEHKQEVLELLRGQRQAEVSAFYSQAFTRLSALYDGDLVGTLWSRIVDEHPTLARGIDTAEAACDLAALSYQNGTAPDSAPFLATLAEWEGRWREAIGAVTASTDRCSDCGRRATVLVGLDYSAAKFCRTCLRPGPIASPPKGRAHA
jgi:ribosomal protein S14